MVKMKLTIDNTDLKINKLSDDMRAKLLFDYLNDNITEVELKLTCYRLGVSVQDVVKG